MKLISASLAVGLFGSASANFEKIQTVFLQMEEAAYNKTVEEDPSQANDRGFSTSSMQKLLDIQYYGCWCYLDTDWDTAKGPVQDGLDQECKNLVSNYRCLVLDAIDRGETCDPATQDYTEYSLLENFLGGGLDLPAECVNENVNEENGQCRIGLCIADGTFTFNLFTLMFQKDGIAASSLYDPNVAHSNNSEANGGTGGTFDPAVECSTNGLSGAGRSEKACCGSYPERFPFKTFNGDKDCCGDRTYATLGLQCCNDADVIDINAVCV